MEEAFIAPGSDPGATRAYLAELRGYLATLDSGVSRLARVAAIARVAGARLDPVLAAAADDTLAVPSPPDGVDRPEVVGLSVQLATEIGDRHTEGMYFTPQPVAAALVAETFDPEHPPATIADVCCGGGAFLLAAARWLEHAGSARLDSVGRLRGVDLDPVAAAATRTALGLWADVAPESVAVVEGNGFDANRVLGAADASWGGPFGAIIGNPPFQSQLGESTARSPEQTDELKERFGDLVRPYVDTAALFLLDSLDHVVDGGAIGLVLPQSVLATRDVEPIRRVVGERAVLRSVWFGDASGFDAAVRVCGLVLDNRSPDEPRRPVRGLGGPEPTFDREFAPPEVPWRWAELNADRQGVPQVVVEATSATVASLATATAGFRDEYYALAGAAVEGTASDPRPRLVTSGLVEVLESRWGVDQARFAKQRWDFPVVDAAKFDEATERQQRWFEQRLVPKVVVATQTRVVEVVADPDGLLVPVTPVISVELVDPERLWHVVAALSSPVVSVVAFRRTAGAAMTSTAIKLSARQVLDLPLPKDGAEWDRGAELAKSLAADLSAAQRSSHDAEAPNDQLAELGRTMCRAYEVQDPEILAWWINRL